MFHYVVHGTTLSGLNGDAKAANARSPHPSVFLFLNLPRGFTGGYITVVLPFLVTNAGLPVLTAASMVAVALSPKAWKVVWAPLADIGLTLKKWYVIGASIAGGMLLVQSLLPLTRSLVPFITAGLFITECGANLLAAPLGALMADREEGNRISEAYRRASPWETRESSGRNEDERRCGLESENLRRPSPQP